MTRQEASSVVGLGLRISGETYAHRGAIKGKGCAWDPGSKSWYAPTEEVRAECQALVGGTLYASPPPADLVGDEDPGVLASRYERTAMAGASTRTYEVYGLNKHDDGDPNGTIHRSRIGKRIVQVARSERRYMSRDFLDDCDIFGEQPGGHYTWDGVEVEPTVEERAIDAAQAAEAAERQQIAKDVAAKAKVEQDARMTAWEAAKSGLVCCTVRPGDIGGTGESIRFGEGSCAYAFRLSDGRLGWHHSITGGDDWRDYYWVPEDVMQAACLASAADRGISPEEAATWLSKYAGCHGEEVYRSIVESDEATQQRLREIAVQKAAKKSASIS